MALAVGWLAFVMIRKKPGFPAAALVFLLAGVSSTAGLYSPPGHPDHVLSYKDRPGLVFGGRVSEPPRIALGRTRLTIDAEEARMTDGAWRPVHGRIGLTIGDDLSQVRQGDRVRFAAELSSIRGFANPGVFDYERFMARRGVWVQAWLSASRDLVLIGYDIGDEGYWLARLRQKASAVIDRAAGQPARGLFKALLLGDQSDIEEDLRQTFRRLGLAHILSVSGLHIALVAFLAFWAVRQILLIRPGLALRIDVSRWAALASFPPIIFYALITGAQPPIIRSAVMVGIFLIALLASRRRDGLSALAAAAWAVLIWDPTALFEASFQLSFAAVAAIILLVPLLPAWPFKRDFQGAGQFEGPGSGARIWQAGQVTAAASIGTFPIVAWHFHRMPWLTLPANLIFGPLLSFGIVPAGLIALAIAPVWPAGAEGLLRLLQWFTWLLLPAMDGLAGWPGAEILTPPPGLGVAALYAAGAGLLLRRSHRRAALACFAAAALGLAGSAGWYLTSIGEVRLKAAILDVGQGSAAHVSLPGGTDLVIDAGGFAGSDFDPGEGILEPYLLHRGVSRVDILALSHPQIDHAGGMPHLARTFGPKEFWSNGQPVDDDLEAALTRASSRLVIRPDLAALGRVRDFGPAKVEILSPPPLADDPGFYRTVRDRPNDLSLVIKVTLGGNVHPVSRGSGKGGRRVFVEPPARRSEGGRPDRAAPRRFKVHDRGLSGRGPAEDRDFFRRSPEPVRLPLRGGAGAGARRRRGRVPHRPEWGRAAGSRWKILEGGNPAVTPGFVVDPNSGIAYTPFTRQVSQL